MEFFDCNVSYGPQTASDPLRPVNTREALQQEMARAGVRRAVLNPPPGGASSGNELLSAEIEAAGNLYGTWAILPTHTHELPGPAELLAVMKPRRIIGWRLCPGPQRFLMRGFALRDWMEIAVAGRVPVFINTAHGATLEDIADLMEAYPELTVVLTFNSDWPSDRFLRPLVREFPNLHLDTTYLITDGGIESFVEEYGAGRLLYGSGFPDSYFGANMLMIRHAQIAEEDKLAIASGNLDRMVREVAL